MLVRRRQPAASRRERPMSESFARFRELVWANPELAQQLWATPEPSEFVDLAVRLGAERGLRFTSEDVRRAMRDGRFAWLARVNL
jgi:Nif11 domain